MINWNCRGFNFFLDEIKMMLKDYDPLVLCCQETYLRSTNTIELRKYSSYHIHSEAVDGRACGGVSVMVKKSIPQRRIALNTNLQAVAVRLYLHKTITICSIYIPPHYQLGNRELNDLLDQLPSPFILLGDMNARNITWGNPDTNNKGHKVEKLISDYRLCIWNDGNPTYIHPATGSLSAIDLSICSPSLFLDFKWDVHDDLCASDHFPTFLHLSHRGTNDNLQRWKLNKADWEEFESIATTELTQTNFAAVVQR